LPAAPTAIRLPDAATDVPKFPPSRGVGAVIFSETQAPPVLE
jgi:hypothetical protein